MKEEWKEIPFLDDGWEASTLGVIRYKGKPRKLSDNGRGRLIIGIKGRHYSVSRLIYCTFNNIPYNYGIDKKISKCTGLVLHKDNNPHNNALDNLYIGTQKDNMSQCSTEGRLIVPKIKGEKNPNAKLSNQDVVNIKKMIKEGILHKNIAKKFGVSLSAIRNISRGATRNQIIYP